ncbi:TonB-dependent receptor [Ideonella dechloratans]|uniref:TonB-dependent receptor n=1 Tax=Ideonella dechloratans TaxID=36863 RepID=A0A643F8L1_IDEDE|nr:TonB-dependent receptor [Ideonella dechloratans]KAB0575094.1 TonB-dependent receptor [Ideonella dechloratans]UFU11995.1 TonB-dependent receptor [Ideonella dechloratans]
MFLRTPVALAVALSAPVFVHAQTSGTNLPATDTTDYVVTASRMPESAAQAVRPVTVITAEDIRQSGAGSVTDLLRTLGGVEITQNGGLGSSSSVFIRGANSDHTVVLVDGVRIGSATLGTAAFESIPLALIERIEVLPGPSSSLYGSDAIGGVIQIFTKSAKRSPGASVALTAGSHDLRQAAASYAAALGEGTQLSLGLNYLSTDGINATTPDNTYNYNPDRDGLLQRSGQLRLTQQINADHEVGVQWLRSASKGRFDDGPGIDSYSDSLTQTLGAHWNGQLAQSWRSELSVARSLDQSTAHSSFPGTFDTREDQASWLNRLAAFGGTATVGLEWLKQSVDSTTAYTVDQRTVRSALVGWKGQIGEHALQADVREDRNSQFGHHTTAQLGWGWQLAQDWRLRAAWGSAFHAPTFNTLYYPGFGNADLKPEKSDSYELGLDGKLAGLELGATVFDNHIRDLIDYAPPDYLPANVNKARITGLSLKLGGLLIDRDTRFKANLTWQDPKNDETEQMLRRRARVYGGLHLTHNAGPAQIGTDLSWVGRRYDSADQSAGSAMGAYGLVAVFGSWAFTPEWRLEARVNNLGDKRYTTAQGYSAPGREGQVTLRWTPAL